jgi:hypothetical protein
MCAFQLTFVNFQQFLRLIRGKFGSPVRLPKQVLCGGILNCLDGYTNYQGKNLDHHGGISSLPTQPPDTHPERRRPLGASKKGKRPPAAPTNNQRTLAAFPLWVAVRMDVRRLGRQRPNPLVVVQIRTLLQYLLIAEVTLVSEIAPW